LREPVAHAAVEPPAAAELLEAARKALDKLEKEMNRAG
jgi:hypothetical protein